MLDAAPIDCHGASTNSSGSMARNSLDMSLLGHPTAPEIVNRGYSVINSSGYCVGGSHERHRQAGCQAVRRENAGIRVRSEADVDTGTTVVLSAITSFVCCGMPTEVGKK